MGAAVLMPILSKKTRLCLRWRGRGRSLITRKMTIMIGMDEVMKRGIVLMKRT